MDLAKRQLTWPPVALLFISSFVFAQQPQPSPLLPIASSAKQSAVEDLAAAVVLLNMDEERRALLAAHKNLLTPVTAQAFIARGDRLRLKGEYGAALNLLKAALDVVTQLQEEAGIARALSGIGRVRHAQNEFKAALELYERSLALWLKLGGRDKGVADVFSDMARTYYAMRNYDAAQANFEKSYKAGQESGNKWAMAAALNGFGIVRFYRGDLKAALEFYQQSLRLSDEIGDLENGSNSLNNIALVYRNWGDYQLAIEFYEKSIKVYEELGAKKRLARALANLANTFSASNDRVSAIKSLQRSIAISEALDDKPVLAMAMNNTGVIYFNQGNYDLALHYFQKSLVLREAGEVEASTISLLNSISDVYREQGRYSEALAANRKSLAMSEALKETRGTITALEGIGDVYRAQGDYPAAIGTYEKTLKLAEQASMKPYSGAILAKLSAVHHALGDHAKALDHAERAGSLARQIGALDLLWRARTGAGQAHRALQQFAEARSAFAEAISTIESLRGQVIGGEREQQSFFVDKLTPYTAMSELLVAQDDARTAFAYAERAKARVLLDVLRRGRVEINKALTPSERERERSLSGELFALNEQVMREREREKPDTSRLNELLTRQQRARLDYEAFQANLYGAHPELAVHRGESRAATFDELGALAADANTALVEYVVAEDRTLLFVITRADKSKPTSIMPPGPAFVDSPLAPESTKSSLDLHCFTLHITRAELTKRIASFRRRLATRDLLFNAEAKQLYQLLLAPAAAQLKSGMRLILVPDGPLWELPFQALLSPQNEYVIEQHAISYAPSLSVLSEMKRGRAQPAKRPQSTSVLLALGNPFLGTRALESGKRKNAGAKAASTNLMSTTFADLPEAERQVRLLATLYGAGASRIYTGAEAREDRFKRESTNFRVLHLATHSVLDDASPMYSHVLLTGSMGGDAANKNARTDLPDSSVDDGLLEAWEIMQLDLHADMVVLSACETARGRIASGEGMIGLSWALFVAGSPATIASQWKVESASTTDLMVAFHRNLQINSVRAHPIRRKGATVMSKAEALRQASLALLRTEKYAHPFYWAAFNIMGNGD